MSLNGAVPNGQQFRAKAQLVWTITASRAIIGGKDAGQIGPLQAQTRLADMWLPQRGIFFVGESYLEPFHATRHWSPTAPVGLASDTHAAA
jgi:hypothetical protein